MNLMTESDPFSEEVPELNAKEQQVLKLFDDPHVTTFHRMWLALTVAGIKELSGLTFPLTKATDGGIIKETGLRNNIPQATKLLESLGFIVVARYETMRDGTELADLTISKNRDKIKRIEKLSSPSLPSDPDSLYAQQRELGILFGYPATAAEAYAYDRSQGIERGDPRSHLLPQEKHPKEDFMAFLSFGLSKDHWQEEIEVVKKWAAATKKLNPGLYQECVVEYRKKNP